MSAFNSYHHAFTVKRTSYTGVNAATMALLLGDAERAALLAQEVSAITTTELETQGRESFWQLATLGECALLMRDVDEARTLYAEAARVGGVSWGDVSSTRRQARRICVEQRMSTDWLTEVLPIPAVVVFAGHRIDEPGRTAPRFPPRAERRVRAAIRKKLDELGAGFGFSGAASGSEILFQEVMLERGGDTYVVLPYDREDYLTTSVRGAQRGDWVRRFEAVMAAACECTTTTPQRSVNQMLLFEYTHAMLLGIAALHARTIDAPVIPLVLWDGDAGGGGTAVAVDSWRRAGHAVEILDINAIAAATR